jgi:hypothetical protein
MKKPEFRLTHIDGTLADLVRLTDQRVLAVWAIDCAERVMPYFSQAYPDDLRPRMAIDTLREWLKTGVFHMAVIRKASLDAHAAARDVGADTSARSAARAAGQAVACAHVPRHALGAAQYALQAISRASASDKAAGAVAAERAWQYRQLCIRLGTL